MKILVTGATGFVGQWLVQELLRQHYQVCILSRKSSSPFVLNSDVFSGVEIVYGDITCKESLLKAFQQVDTVFHLAGHVGYSKAQRPLMESINVEGTRHVLEACEQAKVKKLVYMSSVVAVGSSWDGRIPLDEKAQYNLHHLNLGYFETKLKAEELVLQAVKKGKIDAVVVNPSTIYGEGDAQKGSRKIQIKVARGEFPFYTSGGVSVVGVEDVVLATLAAWQRGRSGERYILSGDNITIKELFAMIAEAAGVPSPYIYLPNMAVKGLGWMGDCLEACGRKGLLNSENAWSSILFHWYDSTKAQKELGFSPQSAEMAIGKSVAWMAKNGYLNSK